MLLGLRDQLVTSRFITPITFRDELSSMYGSGFSSSRRRFSQPISVPTT